MMFCLERLPNKADAEDAVSNTPIQKHRTHYPYLGKQDRDVSHVCSCRAQAQSSACLASAHRARAPPCKHHSGHHQELAGWPGRGCGSSLTTVQSAVLRHTKLGQLETRNTMTTQLQCPHSVGRPGPRTENKTHDPSQERGPAIPRGKKKTQPTNQHKQKF